MPCLSYWKVNNLNKRNLYMIIVVSNILNKTGKTTIATNLAVIRAKNFMDVLLVNADSKSCSDEFVLTREEEGHLPELVCVGNKGSHLGEELISISKLFDYTIVDLESNDYESLNSSLKYADVFVIPLAFNQLISGDLEVIDKMLETTKITNSKLQVIAILNNIKSIEEEATKLKIQETKNKLKNIKLSEDFICHSIDYRKALADGVTIKDLENNNSFTKSVTEISSLYEQIFDESDSSVGDNEELDLKDLGEDNVYYI